MKTPIVSIAATLLLVTVSGSWLYQAHTKAQELDACAKEAWVYACQFEATPIIKEQNKVYVPADILPPPVNQ